MRKRTILKISEFHCVDAMLFRKFGVFDAFIGVDSRFFVDPFLFEQTEIPEFLTARAKIKEHYRQVMVLLSSSKYKEDVAWREAKKRLRFKEFSAASIGYGSKTNKGNAIGPKLALKLANTAAEIICLGVDQPEIFELVGLFEKDYGPDRLSDMTINILIENFLSYSARICRELGITK
ncbi:MAG: hypothetical protein WC269_03420, partial [Candidatus Gracilibacteria bacterium]